MRFVFIFEDTIHSMEDIHQQFAKKLDFPAWYGNNLDALYDCLTDVTEDTYIQIRGYDVLAERIGTPFERLHGLLQDVVEESDYLHLDVR